MFLRTDISILGLVSATNGVVIATENKFKSILADEHSIHKVEKVTNHIGMIYSGKWLSD